MMQQMLQITVFMARTMTGLPPKNQAGSREIG
jgi:hypothetical protein